MKIDDADPVIRAKCAPPLGDQLGSPCDSARSANGWGSFDPHGNLALGAVGLRFPSGPAAGELRRAGVRYVVVHTADVRPAPRARILSGELPRGVHLVAALGDDRGYVIEP